MVMMLMHKGFLGSSPMWSDLLAYCYNGVNYQMGLL